MIALGLCTKNNYHENYQQFVKTNLKQLLKDEYPTQRFAFNGVSFFPITHLKVSCTNWFEVRPDAPGVADVERVTRLFNHWKRDEWQWTGRDSEGHPVVLRGKVWARAFQDTFGSHSVIKACPRDPTPEQVAEYQQNRLRRATRDTQRQKPSSAAKPKL